MAPSKQGMYDRWLLECVFKRGWTTLKCAREIGEDPKVVKWDFEEALGRVRSVNITNKKRYLQF